MVNWIDITKFVPSAATNGLDLRSTSIFLNIDQATNIKRYKVEAETKYAVIVGGKENLLVAKNTTENAAIRKLLGMTNDKESEKA